MIVARRIGDRGIGNNRINREYLPPTRRELHLYRAPAKAFSTQLHRPPPGKVQRLAPRIFRPKDPPRSEYLLTSDDRVRLARANDNNGTWWVARSFYSVPLLERLFTEDKAPRILYETVGGILEHATMADEGFLFIQLNNKGHDPELVNVALEDLRVFPEYAYERSIDLSGREVVTNA